VPAPVFAGEFRGRGAAEFLVDERQKLPGGVAGALPDGRQEAGYGRRSGRPCRSARRPAGTISKNPQPINNRRPTLEDLLAERFARTRASNG
jgi:hypothetical protein